MPYTDEQLSAINTRDRTLLVSAAAGSGKTATLTERIIQSVLDEKNPLDISDMLIVTFTRAAARELSEKITRVIKKALANDKENERLKRQLLLLPAAKISTIDSFCADILKSNTEKFGITPNYRIADTAEANILSLGILNAMLEDTLNGKRPDIAEAEEFESLCSALVGVKSDSELAECFLSLYDKSKSSLLGAEIFKSLAALHRVENGELEKNIYVEYSLNSVRSMAKHYALAFTNLKDSLLGVTASEEKSIVGLENDIEAIMRGVSLNTYLDAREFICTPLPKKPMVKKEEITEGTELYKALREAYKGACGKLYEKLFTFSPEEWKNESEKSERAIMTLARFLEKFDEIYFEEKRRMGALEYSDVEKLALGLLYDGDKVSDIALSLREQFRAVYIDEYQDVSPIQNAIFDAVSRKNNRFMVGDVKQSIYGFRSARPEIFVNMKESFPPLNETVGYTENASVFMSKNFRCDEEIINFVNEIFDKMFDITKDSIAYKSSDRLCYGKNEPCEKRVPSVHIFVKPDKTVEENNGGENAENFVEDKYEDIDESRIAPDFVTNKIRDLVENGKKNSGEKIKYSDVAILFRHNDTVKKYKEALDRAGIPCEAVANKDFFLNPDVLLMLCLLNTIDNPRRDIYLAGLLSSPLFSFTADELYKIKAHYDEGCLYSSLLSYNEKEPNEKSSYFLSKLERYRALSEGVGVDTLISKLYSETGILYLAAKSGGKNNLMLLYNYAKNYEKNGYKGLYSFISYINNIIENEERFEVAGEVEGSDAVKIASVHASKGLEYPVVFLVETQRTTGSVDRTARISYKEDFGLGFKLRDQSGLALVNNPIKNAISLYQDEKNFEEELRVLYVALTRAREELYVVGRMNDKKTSFEEKLKLSRLALTPYSANNMHSFLSVMLASCNESRICVHVENEEAPSKSTAPVSNFEKEKREISKEELNTLKQRIAFEYKYIHQTTLPEKLSISHLSPSILDEEEDDPLTIDRIEGEISERRVLPKFISGKADDESRLAGIATHTFLQFCDFKRLEKTTAKDELERLVAGGFISKENAERVRISEIEAFKSSKLFSELLGAKTVYRELRFNCELSAAMFTESEEKKEALKDEKILLQGVIDCIIENGDGTLLLIDYKTDRLSKEELSNKALAKKKLKEAHSLQLNYYKLAVKEMFNKEPHSARVYSLHLGDTVEI